MIKTLRAVVTVALMMGSALSATAAPVDPLLEFPTTPSGAYRFWTGDIAYDPTYSGYEAQMTIGFGTKTEIRNFIGEGNPSSNPFRFYLSETTIPSEITISLAIKSFLGASLVCSGSEGFCPPDATLTLFKPNPENFTQSGVRLFTGSAPVDSSALSTNPTPVPIGGTLPLMLSALGLGALVMRRRAKRAALA